MIQEAPVKPPYEEVELLSSNALTLHSYESGVQEYINGTPTEVSGSIKEWIDATLAHLPTNAEILEIGSGFGRDANYIESYGFSVERTDAAEAFVTLLQEQGHPARRFNILTDPVHKQYGLIFANAVFLHFTPQELEVVLKKIHAALKDDGIIAFSVKKGEGEEWTTAKLGQPRYFYYWDQDKIESLLKRTGFELVRTSGDDRFLQIIAKLEVKSSCDSLSMTCCLR